ncbi:TlpA disulfide reductase family protein [Paucisalibacillus sp. EB02]|uniref:TlpA family protein disulfide reductase n=1 Tax=Paucisalibacillus sp. EB02 TaxID=1347087 RepID=UPI0004B307D5|nr:TlpA disulfide reductase family protein [Paucisalibacillus sp. EB02]
MFKKIIGIAVLVVLGVFLVINIIETNKKEEASGPNMVDVTGDTSVEGVQIVSPGSVGIQEGDQAPDFELPLLDGEMVKLSELSGQKVLINFWASWCGPCKKEMPELEQLYAEHGDEIKIIAINATDSERNEQVVREYIDENGYTFPVALDADMSVTDQMYRVVSIPTSYFIDTEGKIQTRYVGPMTYEFMINTINSLN